MISVIVITYNSADYIISTLRSIKNQNYDKIELIIADDCSKDNTVEICKKWLSENEEKFVASKLIMNNENLGVSKNIQSAFMECNGEYVKPIAGDDILFKDCLKDNIKFMSENNYDITFSDGVKFIEKGSSTIILGNLMNNVKRSYFNKSKKEIYKKLCTETFMYAPTVFIKRKSFKEIGGFETKYRTVEDLPTWIKIMKNDLKIGYMDIKTVKYRENDLSISKVKNKERFLNIEFINNIEKIYYDELYPIIKEDRNYLIRLYKKSHFYVFKKIIQRGNTESDYTLELKLIKKFNPYSIYRYIIGCERKERR